MLSINEMAQQDEFTLFFYFLINKVAKSPCSFANFNFFPLKFGSQAQNWCAKQALGPSTTALSLADLSPLLKRAG